jgi:hypothetical protein
MVGDLKLSLLLQWPLFFFTLLLLDGGDLSRWTGTALLGYWLGVLAIAVKRADYRSRTDRWFVRRGSVPLMVFAWTAEPAIHRWVHW